MRVIVVAYPVPKDIKALITYKETDYVIAVDQAVQALHEQKIPIALAVGDFDSLDKKELLTSLNKVVLNTEKDETDTKEAILNAYTLNPSQVILIGGIGGARPEHGYANMMLLKQFPDLVIKNEFTTIKRLDTGYHTVTFDGYVSIFALEPTIITLKHFKYPLNEYKMTVSDMIGISNEIIKEPGMIEVKEGSVMIFLTHKD